MEEYLKSLNNEKDYDILIIKLMDFENVNKVKEYYPSLNKRVLLSCFTLNLLNEGKEEFQQSSKRLSEFLINNQKENVISEYRTFFNYFSEWRKEDIDGLKDEISNAQQSLEGMLVEEERDDAETQWNEGVKINMKIMDNTVSLLDKYGKSPPAY